MRTEGLAMRAGPRPRLEEGLLPLIREALTVGRVVEFKYRAGKTGVRSRQRVEPYGVLYGNRAFLVGRTDWTDEPRLWRLDRITEVRVLEETIEQDAKFDLRAYAERSFGTFQEDPVEVVLRFDEDAAHDAGELPVPSEPGQRLERGRHRHSTLPGGRNRRDVLAPRDMGRERHGRGAAPSPAASRRDVRGDCLASPRRRLTPP